MHYVTYFLVPVSKDIKDSADAREHAVQFLNNQGWANQEASWNGSPADWFVVGGRWSGSLTEMHINSRKLTKYCKELEDLKLEPDSGDADKLKENHDLADTLFHVHFPEFEKVRSPFSRDGYATGGYDDDAQIMDKVLYKKLKKGFVDRADGGAGQVMACDWNGIPDKEKDVVGKYWVVVVDSHR